MAQGKSPAATEHRRMLRLLRAHKLSMTVSLILLGVVRHLADVLGGTVDALQERKERTPEHGVIVRTAQPALGLELHILYPA